MKNLKQEVALVKSLFNAAWEKNWGAIPMTDREIDDLAQALKDIADPDLIIFAEIDDKTVGFALAMRDYNYIFKQMNGRLFPFNFLKLFTQKTKLSGYVYCCWVCCPIIAVPDSMPYCTTK